MIKQFYLPRADEDKAIWLLNFAPKLFKYATKYGINQNEIMDMQQSATYFSELLNFRNQHETFQTSITAFKNAIRDGAKNSTTLEPLSIPTINLSMPVAPGVFVRAKSIANRIKTNVHYTMADGNDLGLEGTEVVIDVTAIKPSIKIRLVEGGYPEIIWTKQGMDALEIQKQDANGNWYTLAVDIQPNYIDTSPLPESGKSAVWQYRVIYRRKDKRVGQWSDVVSVTVAG